MSIQFQIIDNTEDWAKMETEWKNLESKSKYASPSMSYDWCKGWWTQFEKVENNTYGFNKKLNIVKGYIGEDIIFIAPLMLVTRKVKFINIIFLEFLGQQWGSIYMSILRNQDFDIDTLFNFLEKSVKYHVLFFRQIPLTENYIFKTQLSNYNGLPFVEIGNYESYKDYSTKIYSKNLKQNLRTANNRIAKDKIELKYVIKSVDSEGFLEIQRLSKMKEIDQKNSLYINSDKAQFYHYIISKMNCNAIFVVFNDIIVSYRVNVIFNNCKFCIDASYDRNYKKYDPGILSVDANFVNSFEMDYFIDNMGPGLDEYKLKFTNTVQPIGFFIKSGNLFLSKVFKTLFLHKIRNK